MAESYEIYIDESGDFEKFSRDQNRAQQKKPIRLIGGVVVPPELVKKERNLNAELSEIRNKYFPGKKSITNIHLSDEDLTWDKKEQLRENMLKFFLEKMDGAKIAFIYDLNPTSCLFLLLSKKLPYFLSPPSVISIGYTCRC